MLFVDRRYKRQRIQVFNFSPGFIEDKIGVKNLYSSDSDGTTQLAVKALDKVLERFPNLRSEIELLVVCTQTPNYQTITTTQTSNYQEVSTTQNPDWSEVA